MMSILDIVGVAMMGLACFVYIVGVAMVIIHRIEYIVCIRCVLRVCRWGSHDEHRQYRVHTHDGGCVLRSYHGGGHDEHRQHRVHTRDSVCAVRAMLVNIVRIPMMGVACFVYIVGVAMVIIHRIEYIVCIPMMGVACSVYMVGVAMMSTGNIVCIPMIVSAQSGRC